MTEKKLFLVVVLVFVCSLEGSPPQKLPNIGTLEQGYNIYLANPDALHSFDPSDPGFKANVWNFQYTENRTTKDGRWLIPDHVQADAEFACSITGSAEQLHTTSAYLLSLKETVSSQGGYARGSFSGSTTFKYVHKHITNDSAVFVSSNGVCAVYKAELNPFGAPKLSDDMISAVHYLPTEYNATTSSKFWEVLDTFGTHFLLSAAYGARWAYMFESTKTQWSDLKRTEIDINTAARWSGLYHAGVSVTSKNIQQLIQTYMKYVSHTFQFSLGNPPPSNLKDVSKWEQETLTSSLLSPLRYTVVSLDKMLMPPWSNNATWAKKGTALSKALSDYCVKHLLPTGKVPSCANPRPPPKIPPSCRFCQGCGGTYPNQIAASTHRGDWSPWLVYADNCVGSLSESSDPIHVCCTDEMPVKACVSGGNGYTVEVGSRVCQGHWDYWWVSGPGCKGTQPSWGSNFAFYAPSYTGCRMCAGGCGPHGMVERGKDARRRSAWKMFSQEHCKSGDPNGYTLYNSGTLLPTWCCPKNVTE